MRHTAHLDTFARDGLPPPEQWPELIFDLPELRYPERLNCSSALVDRMVEAGLAARPAIRGQHRALTHGQLHDEVNQVARVLTEDLALVPGNRVLLRSPNTPTLAVCWLAVVKAGCVAVPTMPLLRAKELAEIIHKARPAAALCDRALDSELSLAQQAAPALEHVVYLNDGGTDDLEARMRTQPTTFPAVDTAADDVALILFTSGTTGKPKATLHFHRDILAVCDCFPRSTLGSRADDIFAGTASLAFAYGIGGLLLFPLRVGASVVLRPQPSPEALLQTIQNERVTVTITVPTFYRQMAGLAGAYDLSSLRHCVSAGESLPQATRTLWRDATGIEIIDGIGSTEMLHIFISASGSDVRPGATGKAIPGYRACVLDEAGNPAPPGQVGRLAVKGPTGCRYLADERQLTYVERGWNVTGDAYLMDTDGYFWYQARTDDLIICAGNKIAGPEVEGVLLQHPAVAECAVVGVPDAERGHIAKAFVVLKPGHNASPGLAAALQDFVKQTLAPFKYPRAVEFLDSLPRTETGKLQRFKLRQQE
jgi:2-aminobenzoate-CoA ligase